MSKTIQFVIEDEEYETLKKAYNNYYDMLKEGNTPNEILKKFSINIYAKALFYKALNDETGFIK